MKKILLSLSLVLSSRVAATVSQKMLCTTRSWTHEPDEPLRQIKRRLDKMPRARVVQTAWGEMLKPNQGKSVAAPLLQYLAGTEQTSALRGYYKVMSMTMTKGLMPSQTLKRWPTRAPASKTKYSLVQLCRMYEYAAR